MFHCYVGGAKYQVVIRQHLPKTCWSHKLVVFWERQQRSWQKTSVAYCLVYLVTCWQLPHNSLPIVLNLDTRLYKVVWSSCSVLATCESHLLLRLRWRLPTSRGQSLGLCTLAWTANLMIVSVPWRLVISAFDGDWRWTWGVTVKVRV